MPFANKMFEATYDIDKRTLLTLKVLEPDSLEDGVEIHLVRDRANSELLKEIRRMGFRKVGRDWSLRADMYVKL